MTHLCSVITVLDDTGPLNHPQPFSHSQDYLKLPSDDIVMLDTLTWQRPLYPHILRLLGPLPPHLVALRKVKEE